MKMKNFRIIKKKVLNGIIKRSIYAKILLKQKNLIMNQNFLLNKISFSLKSKYF